MERVERFPMRVEY